MIRTATKEDFEFIFGLYMHADINPYLLYELMPRDDFRPIFEQLLLTGVLFIFSADGVDSGMFKLIRLQHRTAHIAYLGGVAIAPDMAGKGLGATMFREILGLAREKQIKRVELSVATHNHRAIQLYQKLGFEREGILRQYTYLRQEDRYIDEQLMACLLD